MSGKCIMDDDKVQQLLAELLALDDVHEFKLE